MSARILLAVLSFSTVAAAEKPTILYKAPPSSEEDRPVITRIVASAQGTDYAFKVDFDKSPWGADCKTHCANATVFIDADNNKKTGLKLADEKAPETGGSDFGQVFASTFQVVATLASIAIAYLAATK